MDLNKLWDLIQADLARARSALPDDALSHNAIAKYHEFVEHNELELACDMLEAYAEGHQLSREFWLALRDAAAKMELPSAVRFEARANSSAG